MKYFIDEEFNEDGRTIELISIAFSAEDGREYYAISLEFNPLKCNEWVREHVLKQLPDPKVRPDLWKTRRVIRDEIVEFVGNDPEPDFWAKSGAYDWVCLNQLFGPMVDHPESWPYNAKDVKQMLDFARKVLNKPDLDLPDQGEGEHDAQKDARHTKIEYNFLAAQLNDFFKKKLF